jgi:hypothetical protein
MIFKRGDKPRKTETPKNIQIKGVEEKMSESKAEIKKEDTLIAEKKPVSCPEVNTENVINEKVLKFVDEEGNRIRQETERVQNPIIVKAREEYKKRLTLFLEEESEKIKGEALQAAVKIKTEAESEAKAIVAKANKDKETAQAELEKIKTEAEQEAARIKNAAESESRVIKSQAEDIKKQAETIKTDAQNAAERINSEATKQAQKNAEAEYSRILAEAQQKASTIITENWRRAQEMTDAAEEVFNIVRAQLRESAKVATEAERRMAEAISGHEMGGPGKSVQAQNAPQ